MDVERDTDVSTSSSASSLHATGTSVSSTSELYNLLMSLTPSSTKGRTTAAIIPSLTLPGVDVVIYEAVDDKQLQSFYQSSS
jgi:hypothetical protein